MNHLKKKASLLLALLFLMSHADRVSGQNDPGFDRDLLKVRDELLLKSGASLAGVIGALPESVAEPVTFETSAGDEMVIDRVLISKIEKVDSVAERYNELLDQMKDNAQSHRDIIVWCEEQDRGRVRFRSQILFHRKRILFFEPNDRSARTKLGYTFLKDENRWVDKEQFWSQQGYTRKGDSTLYEETLGNLEQGEKQLGAGKKKLGSWLRNTRRMNHREAVDSLLAFADPQLMPVIYKKYSETKDIGLRAVYVEVFATARPVTTTATQGLVAAAMDDRSNIALDYLLQDGFNRTTTAKLLSKFLASSNNAVVQRAGFALGELNMTSAILPLARALETRHQVAAARQNSGATRTQGNAGGSINQFGGQKAQFRMFQNEDVSGALRKITGQDFGYSEEAYQKWYVQNFTHVNLKARR